MAKSDGSLNKITKHQKTRILPLRWIGNICGAYAGNHLVMAIYLDEDSSWGWHYKYHAKMWKILNKPYELWGTYYILTDSDSLES